MKTTIKRFLPRKDNLCVFWFSLKILGIDVEKSSSKKKSRIIYGIFLLISAWNIWLQIRSMDSMTGVKYVTVSTLGATVTTIFMYLTLLRASAKLKALRKIITFRQVGRRTNTAFVFMYAFVLIAFAFPTINGVVHYFLEDKVAYYSMYNFQDFNIRKALSAVGIIIVTYAQETVPALLWVFFCAVCYQWTMVIKSVIREVQRSVVDVFSDPTKTDIANSLLEECRFLWDGTSKLKEVFSPFLFYLVLTLVMIIFPTFAVLVKLELDIELLCILVLNVFAFTSMVYLASQIPETMKQLVAILKNIDEDSAFKSDAVYLSVLQKRLNKITKKKPIALSVGGWADMNRSFITATLGAILTYGLIIMQTGGD